MIKVGQIYKGANHTIVVIGTSLNDSTLVESIEGRDLGDQFTLTEAQLETSYYEALTVEEVSETEQCVPVYMSDSRNWLLCMKFNDNALDSVVIFETKSATVKTVAANDIVNLPPRSAQELWMKLNTTANLPESLNNSVVQPIFASNSKILAENKASHECALLDTDTLFPPVEIEVGQIWQAYGSMSRTIRIVASCKKESFWVLMRDKGSAPQYVLLTSGAIRKEYSLL